MASRKDYIAAAAALQAISDPADRAKAAQLQADYFAEDNPHFNRATFYRAAGVQA